MRNENLEIWEEVFQNREWGKYPEISVVRFVAKNFYHLSINERKSIKILEIGSGTGANLWFCAREGFKVLALEGSKTAVEKMYKRFREEQLLDALVDVKVGDYFDTLDAIEDESIDAIIDVESLSCNNFIKSRKIVEKCIRKLKPYGKMLSVTFGEGTWGLCGKEEDYHYLIPTDSPLKGLGLTRYSTVEDIYTLYNIENVFIENIGKIERYLDITQNDQVIKEYVVEIKKGSNV